MKTNYRRWFNSLGFSFYWLNNGSTNWIIGIDRYKRDDKMKNVYNLQPITLWYIILKPAFSPIMFAGFVARLFYGRVEEIRLAFMNMEVWMSGIAQWYHIMHKINTLKK